MWPLNGLWSTVEFMHGVMVSSEGERSVGRQSFHDRDCLAQAIYTHRPRSNSMPTWSYSAATQPPIPQSTRPPESTSNVASSLAYITGCR